MPTQDEILAMHIREPKWTAPELAKHFGCTPNQVRGALRRYGRTAPPALHPYYERAVGQRMLQEKMLGKAAYAAGLTLKDIEKIKRDDHVAGA